MAGARVDSYAKSGCHGTGESSSIEDCYSLLLFVHEYSV